MVPDFRFLNLIIVYLPNLIFDSKTDNLDSTDTNSKVKSLCHVICETLKTDISKFIICQLKSHNQNNRTDNQSAVHNSIDQKNSHNSKSLENHISDGQKLVLYLNLETSEALKLHHSPDEKEFEQLFSDKVK